MNRERDLITHINSYFITSKLHGELVSCLDEKRLRQRVYVPVSGASLVGKNMPDGLEHGEVHYSHCFSKMDRLLWPLKMHKIWYNFKKWFTPHPSSVLHAHSLMVNGLIAYRAYKKWKLPYVVTVRETDIHVFLDKLPFMRFPAKKILKHATNIITLSPAYRDIQLQRIFGKTFSNSIRHKTLVVPNGINKPWFAERSRITAPQDSLVVLFAGQMIRRKNFDGLLKACRLLADSGTKLSLIAVGDGSLLEGYKNTCHHPWVTFLGRVSDHQTLKSIFRTAHILAVPSFTESFGLVYPEAMSQGLPVIYTRGQGFDGHFPDGHVGYAVDPRSPEEIADRIRKIMADYDRLSENAFAGASRFSWDKVSDSLISIYEAACEEERRCSVESKIQATPM